MGQESRHGSVGFSASRSISLKAAVKVLARAKLKAYLKKDLLSELTHMVVG